MSNSIKVIVPPLLLTLVGCWSSLGLLAAHNWSTADRINTVQGWVPQDLSGSYDGRVYFRNQTNDQFLMIGQAKLRIEGQQFILSDSQGKQLKGAITTAIITEKENLGVGEIKPENDSPIEIRWYRDKDRNILKIVRAKGAKRLFRFCSASLTQAQCMGRIS